MTDQPTAPPPDYTKLMGPPPDLPRLKPPPQSLEERQARAEFFRRLLSQPHDPADDDGMTDEELNRAIREMG